MARYLTCRELARANPNTLSESAIRAACRRSPTSHPLPHLVCGSARGVLRVEQEVYERWLADEARLNAGLPVGEGG